MKNFILGGITLGIIGGIFFFYHSTTGGWVFAGTAIACFILAGILYYADVGARKEAILRNERLQEIKIKDKTLPNIKDYKLANLPAELLAKCKRDFGENDWTYMTRLFFTHFYDTQVFTDKAANGAKKIRHLVQPHPELVIFILFGKKKEELLGEDKKMATAFFTEVALAKKDSVKLDAAGNKLLKSFARSKIEVLK